MESEPGEIKKLSEVVVGTETTSLTDQTYVFDFQVMHKVPMGGFISILLSADGRNGVGLANPDNMQGNCFYISDQGNIPIECVAGRTEENNRPYVNMTVN